MHRMTRVLALNAFALGFLAVLTPSRMAAQDAAGAAVLSPRDSIVKDSLAKDSVKKAQAECAKASQALNAMIQKMMSAQNAQPQDSTKPKKSGPVSMGISDADLPAGVTMQTLMRCMGGRQQRAAPKPKPRADSAAASAAPADSAKPPKKN